MEKKGFTLVEILISIVLIVLVGVGTTVGVISVNNKRNMARLDEMSAKIYTAVQVLVETNEEIKTELHSNKNGVVIPLNKLQSEGLVDFGDIDIDNHHVLTMLASGDEDERCSGSLYNIGTWTVSNDDVIYICGQNINTTIEERITILEEKISESESNSIKKDLIADSLYGDSFVAKGANPNNYVIFDVDTDEGDPVYFPSEDQDLWRIYSIDSNDTIKLVYNKKIGTDNSKLYSSTTTVYNSTTFYQFASTEFQNTYGASTYFFYSSNTGWSFQEVMSSDNALKKAYLIDDIKNIDWVSDADWRFEYGSNSSGITSLSSTLTSGIKLGTLNSEEFFNTVYNSATWVPYPFVLGTTEYNFTDMIVFPQSMTKLWGYNALYKYASSRYRIYTYDYLPAIVMKDGVKLEKNTSCANDAVHGSKECPYKLSCSTCS